MQFAVLCFAFDKCHCCWQPLCVVSVVLFNHFLFKVEQHVPARGTSTTRSSNIRKKTTFGNILKALKNKNVFKCKLCQQQLSSRTTLRWWWNWFSRYSVVHFCFCAKLNVATFVLYMERHHWHVCSILNQANPSTFSGDLVMIRCGCCA